MNLALAWDFARQLDPSATPGSTVSYFDTACQGIYIDDGQIRTQIGKVEMGQWQDVEYDNEFIISDGGYSVLDVEHNFNGVVWGTTQHDDDVVLLMYEYMTNVSDWVDVVEWALQVDNPIKSGSISVLNADSERFKYDAHTLFAPGARVRLRYAFGDVAMETLGEFFIEDSPFSIGGKVFSFRGRNRLGFTLSTQTFDERTSYTGTKTEVIGEMLDNAGIPSSARMIETDATSVTLTFESSKNYFSGIIEALALMDWYMDDLPDGTLVIGSAAYVKENAAKTGIYSFDLGSECKSQSRTRQVSGVYSRLCVRRKGSSPLSLYADIPYYEGWNVGAHKTFYQDVPDSTSQATMERVRDQLVEAMQYTGITETFEGTFRPWLQIGDVAVVNDFDDVRIAGIITDVKHKIGRGGFFTSFSVTSGGVISNPDNPSTVATKYVNRLGGANRQRRLTDYLLAGSSNTLSGTSITGDQGAPGTPGEDGTDGASAYDIWKALGNTGTEADFIASLSSAAVPVGAVQLWPTGTAPDGWALCDGQAISRTTYTDLFALIGTTYGSGDGSTTFNLPTLTDPATGINYMIKIE